MDRKLRIRSDRFYAVETVPGISGFQRWNERERRIVSGRKARTMRSSVVFEVDMLLGKYRLENGCLPEHQAIVDGHGVTDYLRANPYASAVPMPESEQIPVVFFYRS